MSHNAATLAKIAFFTPGNASKVAYTAYPFMRDTNAVKFLRIGLQEKLPRTFTIEEARGEKLIQSLSADEIQIIDSLISAATNAKNESEFMEMIQTLGGSSSGLNIRTAAEISLDDDDQVNNTISPEDVLLDQNDLAISLEGQLAALKAQNNSLSQNLIQTQSVMSNHRPTVAAAQPASSSAVRQQPPHNNIDVGNVGENEIVFAQPQARPVTSMLTYSTPSSTSMGVTPSRSSSVRNNEALRMEMALKGAEQNVLDIVHMLASHIKTGNDFKPTIMCFMKKRMTPAAAESTYNRLTVLVKGIGFAVLEELDSNSVIDEVFVRCYLWKVASVADHAMRKQKAAAVDAAAEMLDSMHIY